MLYDEFANCLEEWRGYLISHVSLVDGTEIKPKQFRHYLYYPCALMSDRIIILATKKVVNCVVRIREVDSCNQCSIHNWCKKLEEIRNDYKGIFKQRENK